MHIWTFLLGLQTNDSCAAVLQLSSEGVSHLPVHLHVALHKNGGHLPAREGIPTHIAKGLSAKSARQSSAAEVDVSMDIRARQVQGLQCGTHLRRLRSSTVSGRHSRCLCGPGDGFGAKTPESLSSIQWLGALSLHRTRHIGRHCTACKWSEPHTRSQATM